MEADKFLKAKRILPTTMCTEDGEYISVIDVMEEYKKQGRFFTEDEISKIIEDAYENGYHNAIESQINQD